MVGTHALYRSVGRKKSHTVESLTRPLNSHNYSENYLKTKIVEQTYLNMSYKKIFINIGVVRCVTIYSLNDILFSDRLATHSTPHKI